MNKDFVTYEQALALKELGFDEPCLAGYDLNKSMYVSHVTIEDSQYYSSFELKAPLKQQVFRWFREKYELIVSIRHNKFPEMSGKQYYYEYEYKNSYERYVTYEEAENACIDKLIEIVKQN
jgi:hypothetical protein